MIDAIGTSCGYRRLVILPPTALYFDVWGRRSSFETFDLTEIWTVLLRLVDSMKGIFIRPAFRFIEHIGFSDIAGVGEKKPSRKAKNKTEELISSHKNTKKAHVAVIDCIWFALGVHELLKHTSGLIFGQYWKVFVCKEKVHITVLAFRRVTIKNCCLTFVRLVDKTHGARALSPENRCLRKPRWTTLIQQKPTSCTNRVTLTR